MTRTINAEGLEMIKRLEGLRLTAYKPIPSDPWTIGYGHTSAAGVPEVREGMKIAEAHAEEILLLDLSVFERAVEQAVTVPLTDNQFAALVSLCYNIGTKAFRGSTLLKKLNKGDYAGAQDQFRVWRKSGGKVIQGLINRRAQEAALFGRGQFAASSTVEAKPAAPPVISKETVTWFASAVASLGAVGSSFVSGTGPIQWAVAALIVIGGLLLLRDRVFAG